MEIKKQISALDGIEILKVSDQKDDFPEHFHDTLNISFIENGIEAIKMGDNTLLTEIGGISISNPYEVHANPIVESHLKNSFTTLYIGPEVVDHYLQTTGARFSHQQSVNNQQIDSFKHIVLAVLNENPGEIEAHLASFLKTLKTDSGTRLDELKVSDRKWMELTALIDHHLEEKITLEFLSKFMEMNKFNFAKEFRLKFGLSPINYVLMRKIFKIKDQLSKTTHLSQVAYQFNFADQAHFSKLFKRFVGVSPQSYKSQVR